MNMYAMQDAREEGERDTEHLGTLGLTARHGMCVQLGWTNALGPLCQGAVCFCLLICDGLLRLALQALTLGVCQE